ncbi:hypothetical protein [Nocardiopsis chromatogenes]|uniref:hypothetical protein n=1 Tax=Nocardiopsis chromatogenes TaxID=280239 RepID=UPI000379427E|nr:hypothetical protein [Nocardiopsis chromatogenes]
MSADHATVHKQERNGEQPPEHDDLDGGAVPVAAGSGEAPHRVGSEGPAGPTGAVASTGPAGASDPSDPSEPAALASSPGPAAPAPEHRVVLDLDPMTHAELRRAARGRTVESYLYVIAGRYARWSEMRDWLGRLEACYGPLPAEALERVHRRMLGLSQVRGAGNTLSVAFSDEEFAALEEAAEGRPLAPFVRETVIDRLTSTDAAVQRR